MLVRSAKSAGRPAVCKDPLSSISFFGSAFSGGSDICINKRTTRQNMAKELIISVNGREKKIAILDNGRVTEFYIERGEENSGIAGNIYKGRVQRVLPGMQSAFVSIGLERDAFLYVSDFFDEEEEIERIVMEKSKKGSPDDAKREANDQIERRRLEREKQMESVQEIIEPLAGDAEAVAAAAAEPAPAEKKGRRGRRGRDNEKPANAVEQNDVSDDAATDDAAANSVEENFLEPIFEIAEDHDFERIVDNDEDPGEMFKDAYRQESIASTVRAIEFDVEPAAEAVEVGSLDIQADAAGFERIADEDEDEEPAAAEKPKRQTRSRRSKKSDESAETAAAKDNEAADEAAASDDAGAAAEDAGAAAEEAGAAAEDAAGVLVHAARMTVTNSTAIIIATNFLITFSSLSFFMFTRFTVPGRHHWIR